LLSVALFLLGVAIGLIGALIGAGGGFLALPLLLLIFKLPHVAAVGTSLLMVAAGTLIGTLSYARQRKVDWRSGLLFAAAAYPGTMLGTVWASGSSEAGFRLVLALVLLCIAAYLLLRRPLPDHGTLTDEEVAAAGPSTAFRAVRRVTDSSGQIYRFAINPTLGMFASFTVAGLAGALGIGGGVIHMPALILIGYPTHLAAATSQFILLLTSAGAASYHLWHGSFNPAAALALSAGAALGAPFGARLSLIVRGRAITTILALTLVVVAVKLLL
jgi:uncharacterized protein